MSDHDHDDTDIDTDTDTECIDHNHNHNNSNNNINSNIDSNNPLLFSDSYIQYQYKLSTIENTPDFLRCPHIYTGYRVYFSRLLAFQSLCKLHNESINIWTHLLAFLYFLYLYYYSIMIVLPSNNDSNNNTATIIDYLLFNLYCFSGCCCWFNSSLYHLFNCCSESLHNRLYCIDMSSIAILILNSYLPGLYYAFYCYTEYIIFYITIIILLVILYIVLYHSPVCTNSNTNNGNNNSTDINSRKNQFLHRSRSYFLILIIVFSIIPTVHFCLIYSIEFPKLVLLDILLPLILMLVFYLLGYLVYSNRLPESRYPGRFDYLGMSHNLWHCLVSIAAIIWYWNLIRFYQLKSQSICYNNNS